MSRAAPGQMSAAPRVCFVVCHLSGTGHLVRTLTLARAVQAAGGAVTVISGGRPLAHLAAPGVAFVQLPPLSVTDFDYAALRQPSGALAGPEYLAARRAALVGAVGRAAPDALVTELYPLGRRSLAGEFQAALAAAPGAAWIASVRDVPEPPSKPARLAEAAARLAGYAAVLVHGDPAVLGLAESWPLPPEVRGLVRHTGYVGEPGPGLAEPGAGVLVAVGGGVLGRRLLAIAAEAAGRSARPWHLLVGGGDAAEVAAALRAAHPGVAIEPARADYRALLARAAVSVSLAGYNTVMDLAGCDTPAILVPFAEAGQREQTLRAERLARHPGITVLAAEGLTAAALAGAVEAAAGHRRPPLPLDPGGAATAAALILALARERSL